MHIGDSISVNGACLTVIDFTSNYFSVQVIKGTEDKTYLSQINKNDEVNLEEQCQEMDVLEVILF